MTVPASADWFTVEGGGLNKGVVAISRPGLYEWIVPGPTFPAHSSKKGSEVWWLNDGAG
jgi:hypothetical protein